MRVIAPTLVHALGNPENRRRRVRFAGPTNLYTFKFVSCEHPQELLDVIKSGHLAAMGRDYWLEADDGTIFRLGCMYGAEVEAITTINEGSTL